MLNLVKLCFFLFFVMARCALALVAINCSDSFMHVLDKRCENLHSDPDD